MKQYNQRKQEIKHAQHKIIMNCFYLSPTGALSPILFYISPTGDLSPILFCIWSWLARFSNRKQNAKSHRHSKPCKQNCKFTQHDYHWIPHKTMGRMHLAISKHDARNVNAKPEFVSSEVLLWMMLWCVCSLIVPVPTATKRYAYMICRTSPKQNHKQIPNFWCLSIAPLPDKHSSGGPSARMWRALGGTLQFFATCENHDSCTPDLSVFSKHIQQSGSGEGEGGHRQNEAFGFTVCEVVMVTSCLTDVSSLVCDF
mgnify:CR=1 FL=1